MERLQGYSTLRGIKCVFCYLLVLFCCLVVARTQTYLITEAELQILETEYQNNKAYKQKVQSLVQELKQESSTLKQQLTESRTESTKLNTLLTTERQTTRKLSTYLSELEIDRSQLLDQIQEQTNTINRLELKIKNHNIVIIILILIIILGFAGFLLFLKLKK